MTLDDLIAIEEIKQLKARYMRSIDTADNAELAKLFTDDVTAHYVGGSYDIKFEGKATMLEFQANGFHSQVGAVHNVHHPEITITGPTTADGIWYLTDWFHNIRDKQTTWGTALYRDKYRKENGVWKICHTGYHRVFEIVEPVKEPINFTYRHLATAGRKV